MEQTLSFSVDMTKEQEGSYFQLPFSVPEGVERIDITYAYPRHREHTADGFTLREEVNIVDLGLCGPGGNYLGASGSDRLHIYVSGCESAQGYACTPIHAGEWSIVAGAYKIQADGVSVTYTITFTPKQRVLLKGETHAHTLGSDGCMSVADTARAAKNAGLDFLCVTDHNNYAHNFAQVQVDGLSILPGMEWTHYKGHAGMIGVQKPYEGVFYANSAQEMRAKLAQARENGAMIVLNHPFCPNCGWKWGFDAVPYDAVEVWNGPFSQLNADCLKWWHEQLCHGARIVILGGSDFHRPELLRYLGMPATCVYAMSRAPDDILAALRAGHAYISYTKDGPGVDTPMLGEFVRPGEGVMIRFFALREGDLVRIIDENSTEELLCPALCTALTLERPVGKAFLRFEVWRSYGDDLARLPVMISNPVYARASAVPGAEQKKAVTI